MTDFAAARRFMVDCQIRTNNVFGEALVEALAETPRELFVSEDSRAVAYIDSDIACGGGRRLMAPMVFARLVELLDPLPGDVVLDIGCGSGYSSAVLARLAMTVFAVECDPALARAAEANLAALGVDNVVVVDTGLAGGYRDQAPYDGILLEGAVPGLSAGLTDQLADGGRLCAVVKPPGGVGRAVRAIRFGEVVSSAAAFDAGAPMLPGFETAREFVL